MQPEVIVTQSCGRCKRVLPSTDFAPSKRGQDGHYCRACCRDLWPAKNYPARDCTQCRQRFLPKNAVHEYCSNACKVQGWLDREHERVEQGKQARTCQSCGINISHRRSDAKWCSAACSVRHRTPELRRKYRLSSKYGITPEQYDDMAEAQNHCCAICGADEPKTKHMTEHIDHCHDTGVLRQLLCSTCNTGLGSFYDNPEWLKRAAEYVLGFRAS